MSNLFLFTFIMLIITFFIGFFVALIIKIIASWADLLDFCQLHREEQEIAASDGGCYGSIRKGELGCREESTYGSSLARDCSRREIG